jgi:hypothetical protein
LQPTEGDGDPIGGFQGHRLPVVDEAGQRAVLDAGRPRESGQGPATRADEGPQLIGQAGDGGETAAASADDITLWSTWAAAPDTVLARFGRAALKLAGASVRPTPEPTVSNDATPSPPPTGNAPTPETSDASTTDPFTPDPTPAIMQATGPDRRGEGRMVRVASFGAIPVERREWGPSS